jgi:hypothetical protein
MAGFVHTQPLRLAIDVAIFRDKTPALVDRGGLRTPHRP